MLTPASDDRAAARTADGYQRPKLGASVGFGQAHPLYLAAGLIPLPLPSHRKTPPPTGYTGWDGRWPEEADYAVWARSFHDGNLAIRMPESVVVAGAAWAGLGIDADHYEGKTGAAAMAEAEKRFGELPPTYYSTSRDDGSRIRFYRIPTGLRFGGKLAFPELDLGDVELIQYGHRYAVAAPSIHDKTGRLYQWFDADGNLMDEPPAFADWPPLPAAWVEGLPRKDAPRNNSHPAGEKGRTEGGVINVTAAMTEGGPSQKVALRLASALHELARGLSRHDTMCGHVLGLLRFGRNGESGVELALVTLYRAFVDSVAQDRVGGEAEAADEFLRMCSNAEELLAAEPPQQRFEWPGPRPTFGTSRTTAAEEEFWKRRTILGHIRRFARARRVSPWAKFGTTVVRALATIPPDVVLPPLVGGRASLNALVALVGASGAGKDTAELASREGVLLGDCEIPVVPIGSGEGLSRTFRPQGTKPDDPNPVTKAIFSALEIDTWAALAERSGSTLTSEIRKLYTGSILGFGNAGRDTRNIVVAHSYRACVLLGVQPLRSGPLLTAADGGLPQRLVWFPATDPTAPDQAPTAPEPLTITLPSWERPSGLTSVGRIPDWDQSGDHIVLRVPDIARDEIDAHRLAALRGEAGVDPLDRHTLLTRLKVAAALMALDTRTSISEEDWELAGVVMTVSAATRGECQEALSEQSRKKTTTRAHEQADRELIIGDRLTDGRQKRVHGAIKRKLDKVTSAKRRQLEQACTSVLRPEFPAVFDYLFDQGFLVEYGGDGDDTLYRWA